MQAIEVFADAVDQYNVWYKFIDEEEYNSKAYEKFNLAKSLFFNLKNYKKVIECYEFMIISCKVNDIETVLESFIDFLVNYDIYNVKIPNLYNKLIVLYMKKFQFNKVINTKEDIADYYLQINKIDDAERTYIDLLQICCLEPNRYVENAHRLLVIYIKKNKFIDSINLLYDIIEIETVPSFYVYKCLVHLLLLYNIVDIYMAETKALEFAKQYPLLKDNSNYVLIKSILDDNTKYTGRDNIDYVDELLLKEIFKDDSQDVVIII